MPKRKHVIYLVHLDCTVQDLLDHTVPRVIRDITRNVAGKTRYYVEYFVWYLVFLYISRYMYWCIRPYLKAAGDHAPVQRQWWTAPPYYFPPFSQRRHDFPPFQNEAKLTLNQWGVSLVIKNNPAPADRGRQKEMRVMTTPGPPPTYQYSGRPASWLLDKGEGEWNYLGWQRAGSWRKELEDSGGIIPAEPITAELRVTDSEKSLAG